MKIILVVNPKSGRGTGHKLCVELGNELRFRGHDIEVVRIGSESIVGDIFVARIESAHRIVVIGGDGTVHHLLPVLSGLETPMYHLGTGTANLIAHEFGMSKNPKIVADHLEQNAEPFFADLPTCNGIPFLLMVSVGIDASVIHRLEKISSKKRGYRAYIKPVLQELRSPRIGRTSLCINNDEHFEIQQQTVVISNCKSYGGGFNPSPKAKPNDQKIHVAIIPMKTSIGAFFQFVFLKLKLSKLMGVQHDICNQISVVTEDTVYVQVDGEQASSIPGLADGKLVPRIELKISSSTAPKLAIHVPNTHE